MKNFSKKRGILIIVGVYLLIFLPIMFLRFPDARNELKYFVIVEDMIKNGNYLIMKYMGELYPDKPPIYFWLMIFLRKNFSAIFYPLALTLGSLLPALLINLICFNLFTKIKSMKESIIISLSLVSLPYFLGASAVLRMDMMMSLFITGALYIFYTTYFHLEEYKPWKIYAMYALMGIAILVKGGGGFATPITAILTLLLLDRNMGYLKRIKFSLGIGIVLLIVGAWLGALLLQPQGKEYVSLLLGQETLGRALKSKTHVRPFYYYIKMLPMTLFPFTLFFFGALWNSLRNIKNFKSWDTLEKISFSWCVGPFIFFSLMSGKLDIYLLPIYPGAIALTYCFIFNRKNDRAVKNLLYITLGIIFSAILSTNFLTKKLQGILTIRDTLLLTVGVGGAAALGLYYNLKDERYKTLFSLLGVLLILFGTTPLFLENYNDKTSLSPVITYINTTPYPADEVVMYKFPDGVNIKTEITKEVIATASLEKLDSKPVLIISRAKYKKDLKEFKEVFFNNEYSIFLNR